MEWRKLHDALRKSTPSTPSPTEPTPAYVNKCPGWSCEQNGQICVENVPVVLWGREAGFFPKMLGRDESDGSYYLCNDNTWSGISRTEANNHLTRRFRDKGAIGD